MITVGTLHAGTVSNVIPEEATFKATVRTTDEKTRQLLAERIPAVCKGIAETFRGTAEVEYTFGYPPLVNDDAMAALVREVALDVVGAERIADVPPGMGAEDMSYLINAASGAFYRLGVRNEERGITYGHHHPRFDIDEEALSTGVAMHAAVALRFLQD